MSNDKDLRAGGPASLPVLSINRAWHCETEGDGSSFLLKPDSLHVTTTPHARQMNTEVERSLADSDDVRVRPWVELYHESGRFVDARAALSSEARVDVLLRWAEANSLLRSSGAGQWFGTAALADAAGCEPTDGNDAIELALRVFVEKECPEIDGLWWSKEYDAFSSSTPHGEILPGRLARWEAITVDQANRDSVTDEPYVPDAFELAVGSQPGRDSRPRPRA